MIASMNEANDLLNVNPPHNIRLKQLDVWFLHKLLPGVLMDPQVKQAIASRVICLHEEQRGPTR